MYTHCQVRFLAIYTNRKQISSAFCLHLIKCRQKVGDILRIRLALYMFSMYQEKYKDQ